MPVSQALLAEEIRGPFEIISLSGELFYLFHGGQLWSQVIRRNSRHAALSTCRR